jgi:hypothetical protein
VNNLKLDLLPAELKEQIYDILHQAAIRYLTEKDFVKAKLIVDLIGNAEAESNPAEVTTEESYNEAAKSSALPPPPLGGKDSLNTMMSITDEEVDYFMYMLIEIIEETEYFNYDTKYTTFQFQQALTQHFDISEYDIVLSNGPRHTRSKWKVLVSQAISKMVYSNLLSKESRYYYKLTDSYVTRIKKTKQKIDTEPVEELATTEPPQEVAPPVTMPTGTLEVQVNLDECEHWKPVVKPTIYRLYEN